MSELARRIAHDLFTNADGEHADRLRMTSLTGHYLGGWSEQGMTQRIQSILEPLWREQLEAAFIAGANNDQYPQAEPDFEAFLTTLKTP